MSPSARRTAPTDDVDRAVALDGVVAELAEDLVVARAAGDVVVAEPVERCGLRHNIVVEELDVEVLPDGGAAGDPARAWIDQDCAC